MKETIETANSFIKKANDFKYFVLLGTFILVLDSALVGYYDTPLIKFTFETAKEKLSLGGILLFLGFFTLYISFAVGALRYSLIFLITSLPCKFTALFNNPEKYSYESEHFISESDLKKYAIHNDNSVAYSYLLSWQQSESDIKLLEHYSLAFLVASILNAAASDSNDVVLGFLLNINQNAGFFSIETIVVILSALLYGSLFYLGVLIGCGLIHVPNNGIFIYNHGFETNEWLKIKE